MKVSVLHLSAAGMSQRAVKLRKLDIAELDECLSCAALEAGENQQKLFSLRVREGVMRCVVAVTAPVKSVDEVKAETWQAVSLQDLQMPGPKSFGKLFEPKDYQALMQWFRRAHDASVNEVEAVLGGELLVSEA